MVQFATDSMTREAGQGLARAISLHGMRTPSLKAIGETMSASVPTVHRWLGGGRRRLARVVGAHLGVIIDVMRDRTGARARLDRRGRVPMGRRLRVKEILLSPDGRVVRLGVAASGCLSTL